MGVFCNGDQSLSPSMNHVTHITNLVKHMDRWWCGWVRVRICDTNTHTHTHTQIRADENESWGKKYAQRMQELLAVTKLSKQEAVDFVSSHTQAPVTFEQVSVRQDVVVCYLVSFFLCLRVDGGLCVESCPSCVIFLCFGLHVGCVSSRARVPINVEQVSVRTRRIV